MTTRSSLFSSSVGTKLILGLTGLAMVGFLIGHLAGNVLILVGPEVFNNYGHALISNPLLIPAEFGLLALLFLHVIKAIRNQRTNRAARPVDYTLKVGAGHTSRKSAASTSMIVTGLVILGFLAVHIRMFKYGPFYAVDGSDIRDLHRPSFRSSSLARDWPARRRRHPWASWATACPASAFTTAHDAPTASPQRTIRTTATACSVSSTTRSRVAIIGRERPTSTAWRS